MNPFAIHLQNAYFRANTASLETGHGRLRKGRFMIEAYPDQDYANEASARRQFNKVVSGQTTGKRIEKRGGTPYVVSHHIYGKKAGQTVGGGRIGLWKVNVTGNTVQGGGPETVTTKSFIVQSSEYTTMEDVPYLNLIMPAIVEEWLAALDYPLYDTSIEILPIRRSEVPEERRYELDTLEIE